MSRFFNNINIKEDIKQENNNNNDNKDNNGSKGALAAIAVIILIGIVSFIGIKFNFFNSNNIKVPDAENYIKTINGYIVKFNGDNNSYTINNQKYTFLEIPSSNLCILDNGNWNSEECKSFINDITSNYCRLKIYGCSLNPDKAYLKFNNGKLTSDTYLIYNDAKCTYNEENKTINYEKTKKE